MNIWQGRDLGGSAKFVNFAQQCKFAPLTPNTYSSMARCDYSTAYFYDKEGHPCRKEDAAYMNIVEFKRGGERVNEFYGDMSL